MRVSVVVCAYTEQRWDDLVAGYESLLAQTAPADEIVLVVDHSELLLRRARRFFSHATVIPNARERGLSGARNSGIAASGGDVVLFLDDDAAPVATWVERMRAAFDDPRVVGVAGWADPRWDPPGRPRWFPESFLWVVGCSYEGLPLRASRVRNPIGCSMGFRRSVLERVGGFSTGLGRVGKHPAGCEETELAIRVQQLDPSFSIVHEPRAVVHHRVTAERLSVSYFVRRCFWEGYSKAAVSRMVGRRDALSAESSYTTRTLPIAFVRGISRFARRGSAADACQSLMLVVGLAATVLGYAHGVATAAPDHTPRAANPALTSMSAA